MHLPPLISDLALILGAAGVMTLIFKMIKQPVVLGYILAGFLVSSHFTFFPSVSQPQNISIWAEIGVIFLLFGLGLEFSFKKLLKVGPSASVTALVEVVLMGGIGFFVGKYLGWSYFDCLFLAGILSISSTTIIIRAFDELGIKTQKFATLVFGVLVVEDLLAIVILVLLTTFSLTQQFAGDQVVLSLLRLGFFLSLWFLAGIYLIPTFLKRIQNHINNEMMLVISLALCLFMVTLSVKAQFSPALGAFVMGSILAETAYAEKIEHLIASVKDLFGAIFFVSVGMLINPSVLIEYKWLILGLTGVTIVGKVFSTALGALLSGQALKPSVKAGLSLAQIGEFSFIIATLGITLKVTSSFLYPVAIAVSALTTFTTPYLIKYSNHVYEALDHMLPEKLKDTLNRYSSSTETLQTTNHWKMLLKSYAVFILTYGVVLTALASLGLKFISPWIFTLITQPNWAATLVAAIILSAMLPFLWALAFRPINSLSYKQLWVNQRVNRGPLVLLELGRIGLAIFFISAILYETLSTVLAVGSGLGLVATMLFIFSKRLQAFHNRLEKRFFNNLNQRNLPPQNTPHALAPWDAHMAFFEVPAESALVGIPLKALGLREKYGINIAVIERGRLKINLPGPNHMLFPFDTVGIIGTDDQLSIFYTDFKTNLLHPSNENKDVQLHCIVLPHHSSFIGKTIIDSGIRKMTKGLIFGLERQGTRFLNPASDVIFEKGDILWIAGEEGLSL